MKKNTSLLVIGLLMCMTSLTAQKKGVAPTWPGVPYSYVKVYLYNLDNQLMGRYQPVKNGKLDPTVVGKGQRLTEPQAKELLDILNSDTRVLNDGMAKCYEPHHAFVFYDDKDNIVASSDVCFLCQGVKFYPAKKYYKELSSHSSAQTKAAEKQLEQIKALVQKTEVPVLTASKDYLLMADKMAKKDTLVVLYDSMFINLIKPFKKLKQVINAIPYAKNVVVDSTVRTIPGGDKVVLYFVSADNIELECSSYNGGNIWITMVKASKSRTGLFTKIDVQDQRYEVFEKIITKVPSYPYQKVWYIVTNTESVYYTFDENHNIGSVHYKSHR